MPLFQKSVLNKFIKSQDASKIEESYQRYSNSFLRAERQLEIRSMKEEEYQDGFLDDLFVNILGYIKRPNEGYNLVREKKNEADSKKADGAILKNNVPLAVIELKGTDTRDLDKVTNQGFGYKNNNKECVYVITSNFEKLRFYIHNAVEHIEFNLFTLTKDEFVTLWLCLHSDNLLDNIPAKIKDESVVKEEDITKNLYKDYSSFKQELWQSIVNLNPNGEPIMFYKKTQKLIDRFLFIFFAEDAGLLPPNSISRMVDRWKTLKDEDSYKPLYEIFKQYFGYINTGRQGKTPQDEIFAYNGGLMAEDEILETVNISDDVLLKHVSRLTTYDFSSEVDVNILGHIFENSLNDIEAVTAELEGLEIDKSKTKRKKDGVFYTPKYITKYIVDNTVGKLCDEKKIELNIIDEEYAKGRNNRKKETLKQLDENLQAYRNWLLNITICDPACGSGAFLNQALEFLMEEHRYINELESQLLGAGFTFPGVENHILENNIFGVDINDESIEIAKLSLWLRTAQRGRKLTSLNNNIKCGNSLIDDPEVAGDKAFNWEKEFPSVFEKGGFDVIIGNPPYVRPSKMSNSSKEYYWKYFRSFKAKSDLYSIFMEKGILIAKNNGLISYIVPHTWVSLESFEEIRKIILEKTNIQELVRLQKKVFEDATVETCIFTLEKSSTINKNNLINIKYLDQNKQDFLFRFKQEIIQQSHLNNFQLYTDFNTKPILDKVNSFKSLDAYVVLKYGFKTGDDNKFISEYKETNDHYPFIRSGDLKRYYFPHPNEYVWYMPQLMRENKDTARPGDFERFKEEKIIVARMGKGIEVAYDNSGLFVKDAMLLSQKVKIDLKSITGILNSKLINFFYKEYFNTIDVLKNALLSLPINVDDKYFLGISNLVEKISTLILNGKNHSLKFLMFCKSSISGFEFNSVIENWSHLNFADFIYEINKIIKKNGQIQLTKKDEFEWMELFEENKKKAIEIKSQIDQTDKEIDFMVYELYGLTDEEIQIVENSR